MFLVLMEDGRTRVVLDLAQRDQKLATPAKKVVLDCILAVYDGSDAWPCNTGFCVSCKGQVVKASDGCH